MCSKILLFFLFFGFVFSSFGKELGYIPASIYEKESGKYSEFRIYLSTDSKQKSDKAEIYFHYTDVNSFNDVSFTLDKESVSKLVSLLNGTLSSKKSISISTSYSGFWQNEGWVYNRKTSKITLKFLNHKKLGKVFEFSLPVISDGKLKLKPRPLYFKKSNFKKIVSTFKEFSYRDIASQKNIK